MRPTDCIQIHPNDNVAVAIHDLPKSAAISLSQQEEFTTIQEIPAGHKVALKPINKGAHIIKYGYPIGHALQAIKKGEWINEKKIKTNLSGTLEYSYVPELKPLNIANEHRTFDGYVRANGSVGTRNELWIVPTVGCVNGIVNRLANELYRETQGKGVDAIVAFPHNYGCSQLGDDHENTRKILRNVVLHPNAGGVLIIGLGCENNQLSSFKELLGDIDPQRIRFMETQKVKDEYEQGMQILRELYDIVIEDKRAPVSVAKLTVGLKCGGSDGFSGITANPLLGQFSDWLVAQGGSSVLTEVPEMFGAETILMNRCATPPLFDKTVLLINDFKDYFIRNKQPIYENPSPGNKAGGISTLEEKSLGCTQKCGTSTVRGVMMYGEQLSTPGLNLLSAPGNDLVAATALAASGCQIVLFTTGRGTPFGTFVPTMKISTNTALSVNKPGWIDFNAGQLLENVSMDHLLADYIDYIIRVASGEQVQNEKHGYREIAIFKTGVTL